MLARPPARPHARPPAGPHSPQLAGAACARERPPLTPPCSPHTRPPPPPVALLPPFPCSPPAQGQLHWAAPLLSRLSPSVKLVGPTISCEGSPLDGDQAGVWRTNPHVQSYVVATDAAGLQLLVADGRVFKCHQ